MTTQRDLETAAEVSLTICSKCGWYDGFNHAERCRPEHGRAAQQLIAAVPDVRSGQLGYGDGHVIFEIVGTDFTVVFQRRQNAFSLRDVSLRDDLSVEESAALVRALKGWVEDIGNKRIDAHEARKREMTHHISCSTTDTPKRTEDWSLVNCPTCLRSDKNPANQ
jgi:hypothetical protein